jgi:hypothetical protein
VVAVSPDLASKPVARVSLLTLKTKVDGLSVVWPQNHWDGCLWFGLKTGGDGFSWFVLKTGGSGFPVWASKSPRWFLDLDLKTKQTSIYWLWLKIGRRTMAWETRRDLATCLTGKQVRLEFPNLASRLADAPLWRLCQSQVEDGRVYVTGCVGLCYPCFTIFFLLGHRGIVVI